MTTESTAAVTGAHPETEVDPFRQALRGMWSAAAPAWARHAAFVDGRGSAVTDAMLERAGVRPGAAVIELACGPGGVGLAAADRVGPTGTVLLSDVVAEMVAVAADRAAAVGRANVRTAVLDLEHVAQPDASFDAALCREGLMLVPDPVAAAGELRRILRPGGRAGVAVWAARDRNPWLAALLDAVSDHVGTPVPPPGIPGPFSLDDPDRLAGVLGDAGFADVTVDEVAEPCRVGSFDEWWSVVPGLAGPVGQILAGMADADRDAIRQRARAALEPYAGAEGYDIPGVSLVGAGRRP